MGSLALKWAPVVALLAGGIWGLFKWHESGGRDWMINMEMSSEVLPYTDTTRLLLVRLKSKNPTDHTVEFGKADSNFTINVFAVPSGLPTNTVVDGEKGRKLASVELMPSEGYVFLPQAEFEDSAMVVVAKGSTVFVSADLHHSGDDVSVDKVVVVGP
jgi:hypothetical protein